MNPPLHELEAYFAGDPTAEQLRAVEAWIIADPANAKAFMDQLRFRELVGERIRERRSDTGNVLAELARMEAAAPVITLPVQPDESPKKAVDPNEPTPQDYINAGRYVLRMALTSKPAKKFYGRVAVAAGLLLAVTLLVVFTRDAPNESNDTVADLDFWDDIDTSTPPAVAPETTAVATLTATHNAVWASPQAEGALAPVSGSQLHPNTRLTLTAGFAEITTARGAIAILEAPCVVELKDNDNALRLISGKLVGICETESSKGFTVDTPTARVIDYGTEFGVAVDLNRETSVMVYQGEVGVAARRNGAIIDEPVRLIKQQAATVGPQHTSVVRIDFDESAFRQRRILKRLDLVDIVAGGDGLGDASGRGIDYRNGQVVDHAAMAQKDEQAWNIPSAVPLSRVPAYAMIDSVFIVDRHRGSAVLDSEGTVFDRFPRTESGVILSDLFGYGFVQAISDGKLVLPIGHPGSIDQTYAAIKKPELDGRAIALHGGGGITFDLAQIRRRHNDAVPSRFSAHALNAESLIRSGSELNKVSTADFWVLVDGKPRFEAKAIRTDDGAIKIDIVLKPGDRFLTLVVSDGGDSIAQDWVVLSRPTLEFSRLTETD